MKTLFIWAMTIVACTLVLFGSHHLMFHGLDAIGTPGKLIDARGAVTAHGVGISFFVGLVACSLALMFGYWFLLKVGNFVERLSELNAGLWLLMLLASALTSSCSPKMSKTTRTYYRNFNGNMNWQKNASIPEPVHYMSLKEYSSRQQGNDLPRYGRIVIR